MGAINATDRSPWGEPEYFTCLYIIKYPFAENVLLVVFSSDGIEEPNSEPIGVVHFAGIRRYLWKAQLWTEYDLDYRSALENLKRAGVSLRIPKLTLKILLDGYGQLVPPTPGCVGRGPFVRAITKIDGELYG